jgi:uncharacterized protein (DUF488 family)
MARGISGNLMAPAPPAWGPARGTHTGGVLFTVGHSTRSLDEFLALCQGHGLQAIVDVRRFPGSRRSPHFGREPLAQALESAGIAYQWRPELGGRRSRPRGAPPSPWRVAAFAAYADHMRSPEFRAAIATVLDAARGTPTAVMCAEAVPYQCHRRLISDWATLHGTPVIHLLDVRRREPHRVAEFARLEGDDVVYDAVQGSLPGVGRGGGPPANG